MTLPQAIILAALYAAAPIGVYVGGETLRSVIRAKRWAFLLPSALFTLGSLVISALGFLQALKHFSGGVH